MTYLRILCVTSAGIGSFCGSCIDQWGKKTFKVKAQMLDLERTPGSEHYQNPHLRSRFAKFGLPQRDVTLRYKHYQMSYDQKNRMPNWVLEHLSCERLNALESGELCGRSFQFHIDRRIPKEFQSDGIDFQTDMLRFTLADFSNYAHSSQGITDCHLRTNTVPMNLQFQTGVWRDLEIYCRYLTQIYDDVYVFSGPLFEPITLRGLMRYQVSQTNHLGFPSHYYKIVIAVKDGCFHLGCYLLPNRRAPPHQELGEYRVPLSLVERKAGFKLFKDGVELPDNLEEVLDFRRNRLHYVPNENLEGEVPLFLEDFDFGDNEQNGQNGHNGHAE